jgi:hypothetical protein
VIDTTPSDGNMHDDHDNLVPYLEMKTEETCNPMELKAKVYARVCILVIKTPRGCDHI